MTNKNLFRADTVRGVAQVNRSQEIITGVAVVTKGLTKDNRGEFDIAALDQIVMLGNESILGIKSRFGHPNMSSTAMGTFLGRMKNFHRDHEVVRADLAIDPTAHTTPQGDLAAYVMHLAENDPDAFGASMVITWEEEYRKDTHGALEKDGSGKLLPPCIRPRKLFSVDVVDDPAANNGFFSHSVQLSAEMTMFLDKFLAQEDAVENVIAFLQRYHTNKPSREENTMAEPMTLEQFKQDYADMYRQIEEETVKQERKRVSSILKKSFQFHEMRELAVSAIEQGLSFDKALISFQEKQLELLQKASAPKVGPDAEPVSAEKTHLERAKEYQMQYKCSITDALKATAQKGAPHVAV